MTTPVDTNTTTASALITELRALTPPRSLTFTESLRIAKLQAIRLLRHLAIEDAPVPIELILRDAGVHITAQPLPASGFSHWSGRHWVITTNSRESWQRQRATIAHEFKHILDHPQTAHLYVSVSRLGASEQAELAATYFAGCVLVPRHLLKQAWFNGMQNLTDLAEHFDVSPSAIATRLHQTGIAELHDLTPERRYRPRRSPL